MVDGGDERTERKRAVIYGSGADSSVSPLLPFSLSFHLSNVMWSRIGPKMGTGVLVVPWVDSAAFVVVAQGGGHKVVRSPCMAAYNQPFATNPNSSR